MWLRQCIDARGDGTSHAVPRRRSWRGTRLLLALGLVGGFFAVLPLVQAGAQPTITVERTTWDMIGIRHNANNNTWPDRSPRDFPVGIEVCNTSSVPATDLVVDINLGTLRLPAANPAPRAADTLILIGGETSTSRNIGDLAAGACRQTYFTVRASRDTQINRVRNSFGANRDYRRLDPVERARLVAPRGGVAVTVAAVELVGEGDQTTEDFTVEGAWELRWEMTGGDRLEVELAGDEERMIVEREGEGSGSIYPRASGTFRFDVESDGRWSLRVFDVAD